MAANERVWLQPMPESWCRFDAQRSEVRMMKVKYLPVAEGRKCHISAYPNFHKSGSVEGMRRDFYGKDALLVRCGSWIYNVSEAPWIYWGRAH